MEKQTHGDSEPISDKSQNRSSRNTAGRDQQPSRGDMADGAFRDALRSASDLAASYLEDLEERPVLPDVQPGEVRAGLPEDLPEAGEPMAQILSDFEEQVLPGLTHWNHPGFFAYFNATSSGPAIVAELLAATVNANAMLWKSAPAATEVEEHACDWLRELLGLPEAFRGIIYEGGSASNFHALAAARHRAVGPQLREQGLAGAGGLRLRLYVSEQVHSSIDKAAVALGLGTESIRRVASDERFRMRTDALQEAVAADRRSSEWQPFGVACNIGSTSTTSVDPVADIATVCEEEDLWLHVDAAHGGALAMLEEKQALFEGWERADSITVNPHKWLFVPIGCSVLFTRRSEVLRQSFSLVPEYLRTEEGAGRRATDLMDYGIPLGRPFRVLKLYFALRYFGREGLAARLREHLRIADRLAEWIDDDPRFERLAPVPMSTVCFRARPETVAGDEERLHRLNERLMNAVNETGEAFLSHTELGGRFTLRIVVSGLRTEERHVEHTFDLLQEKLSGIDA